MNKLLTTLILISVCTLAQAKDDSKKPYEDNFGSAYDPANSYNVNPRLDPTSTPISEPISRPISEPIADPVFTPSDPKWRDRYK